MPMTVAERPTLLPDGLVLRDFNPATDDIACKQLEVTASQFQGFNGLIKAAIVHHGGFNAKPSQFEKHLLLVVVDKEVVCGVVAVAIKRVFVHGAVQPCGFVFDLRVSEQYQRRGIGAALTSEAEARAEKMGVTYLYLSVNNENKKARALYATQGWNKASSRALIFRPLLYAPPADGAAKAAVTKSPSGNVLRLEAGRALELTAAHFARRDLGLSRPEFERLFASPNLIGTFIAEDGDPSEPSRAILSLWHGSTLTAFTPITILLPVAWWVRLAPLVGLLAAAATAASVRAMLRFAAGPLSQGLVVAGATLGVAAAIGLWRWARSRTAFRARAFGPCASGPRWQPLMRAVHSHVAAEARARGFGILVINEDARSPLVDCLYPSAKPRSPTSFWQKRLPPPPPWSDEGVLPILYPDAFFDPRDM